VVNEKVALTEEIAEGEEIYKDEERELYIDKDSVNIDVVPVSRIEDAFPPDIASELNEQIKIYQEVIAQRKEENKEKQDIELAQAQQGINVINTYPLGVHADVILQNMDFSKPFDAEISFRVNIDGSFRAIDVSESSGMPIIDKSLENIIKELSSQKVAFFTNFRRMSIILDSDGENLSFTLKAFLKDDLNASSIYLLLNTAIQASKINNKDDEETMTLLNSLELKQVSNTILLTIKAGTLFVKESIKD
jgi:hypothetical protein